MKTTIVPVSGGKDSQVVLALALKRRKNVVCVHQNTGWDHPVTYEQLTAMESFYGVTIEQTESGYKKGMLGFLDKAQYFPNSAARGCTQELKQLPFANWLLSKGFNSHNCEIWFGMRSDESATRASKYGEKLSNVTFDLSDISAFYAKNKEYRAKLATIPTLLPIVDWSTERVFNFLRKSGAPINALYERGHSRVGCYPCLLARKSEWAAAGQDKLGRKHIKELVKREDKWLAENNPRKFIRVHRVWDVRDFLTDASKCRELANEECGYCSI